LPQECYASAADVLEALDRVSEQIPANPEAWDRLLLHVRDHGQQGVVWKQSA